MIKIDFEFESNFGVYRDALYLPEDHTYTDDEINAMKQERFDNWIAVVTAPPVETVEEVVEIEGVQYEKVEIEGQTVLKPIGA